MKANKEILDEFGRIIINNVFDNQYKFILNSLSDLKQTEGYPNSFNEMSLQQKKNYYNWFREKSRRDH